MERVTSRSNPLAAHIKKLRGSRSYRRETGCFFCEGLKMLSEALRWEAGLLTVVAAEGVSLPPLSGAVRQVTVPESLLSSLADTETPQGVLFVCAMPSLAPPAKLEGKRYLVLDGVQDPGNVGTILRTADAFGADGVFLLNGCADPFSPKTVRSTMGAVFRLPIWETDADNLRGLLRDAGIPIFAAALSPEAADVRSADLSRAAVVIGSEGSGISKEVLALADRSIIIPMTSRCESLNAAAAAAVTLWEMFRAT